MKGTEIPEARFMRRAVELAAYALDHGLGGPFGAVVVKEGMIIGEGFNQVTSINDPTAHAEVMAIREACKNMAAFQLTGCDLYSSCEPCPMCLGAIYWARPDRLFYGSTRHDAADAGFDDDFIYREMALPEEKRKMNLTYFPDENARAVFRRWKEKEYKTAY